MSATAIEILNPVAFEMEEIVDLLREGLGFGVRMDVDGDIEFLRNTVGDPDLGLLIARGSDGKFGGFAVINAGTGPFAPVPQILHFHAPKNVGVKMALVKKMKEWVYVRGITVLWAINMTGIPDESYARLFGKKATIKPVGSVMEFNIVTDEDTT